MRLNGHQVKSADSNMVTLMLLLTKANNIGTDLSHASFIEDSQLTCYNMLQYNKGHATWLVPRLNAHIMIREVVLKFALN